MMDFKQAAEYHDRQMFRALACPPTAIGKGFHWTRFHRWYWDMVLRGGR